MSCIHNSAIDPRLRKYRGADYYYADLARAYASSACSDQCAPFKNSPGTYDTCCKQHAANAPKNPPITPAPGPSPSKSSSSKKSSKSPSTSDVNKEDCKAAFGGDCTKECASPNQDSENCKTCVQACGAPTGTTTTPSTTDTTTPTTTDTTTPTETTTTEEPSATSSGSGFSMSSLFQSVCGSSKIPLLCNNEGTFTAIVVILAVTFIVLIMKRL